MKKHTLGTITTPNSATAPKSQKNTFFKGGNPAIFLQVILIAIQAIASAFTLYSIGEILSCAFSAHPQPMPAVSRGTLWEWCGAGLAWLTVATITHIALGICRTQSINREAMRLRQGLLAKAFQLGTARFTGKEAGRTVSAMTDSVERVTEYRQGYLAQLFGAILTPFLTLVIVAFFIDALSALILLVCLPFVPLTIGTFQRLFSKDSSASRKMRALLAGQFLEAIQGLPTLVGIGGAQITGERLARTGEENRQALMRILSRNQLLLFVMEAVFSLFLVVVAIILAYTRFTAGAMTSGGAIALILLSTQLTAPLNEVGGFFYIGMAGRAGMRAMAEFMSRTNTPHSESEHQVLVPATLQTAAMNRDSQISPPSPLAQSAAAQNLAVAFAKVSFRYFADENAPLVLRETDFQLSDKQTAVLLGTSGSGKSTLLAIMAGDLLPASGSATIAGIPLTRGTQDQVRAQSALVRQKTWIFTGSLASNLRLANPNASDAQLYEALEKVALKDWALALPQQLATDLGERGALISGGQAQRVSIARAILADRPLLIFDEPTSQVDLESEAIIEKSIRDLSAQKTVVLATHRLALADLGTQYFIADGTISVASTRTTEAQED